MMSDDVKIERIWAMPNKNTFDILPNGGWHNDTICTVEIKT